MTCFNSVASRRNSISWNSGLFRSRRMRLWAAGTLTRDLSCFCLQQRIQVRFSRLCLCRPIQTALNPGAIRFRQGPELAFGHHGYGSEYDAAILESFQAQGLACETLPEGYLAASAYGLEFCTVGSNPCAHAIMLSCLHAWCKGAMRGRIRSS